MLAFLKNIFARRSAPPARPALSHGTPSPAAHRGGSRPAPGGAPAAPTLLAPSRAPAPVEEPPDETPPPRFSTAPVPVPTVDPTAVVAVPWSAIFPRLHPALIKMAKHQPKSGDVLKLPLQAVLLQLASGAIRFRFEDFVAMTPNGCFAGADPGPVPLVELPLVEILRHVDNSYLARRPEQHRIVVPDDIGTVFGKKDGNLKVITDKKAFAPATASALPVREVEESLAAHSSPPPLAPPKPPVQAAPAAPAPAAVPRPTAPSLAPPKPAVPPAPVSAAATAPLPASPSLPKPSAPALKTDSTPTPPSIPAIKPPAGLTAPKAAPLPASSPLPKPPSLPPQPALSRPAASGAALPQLRLAAEPASDAAPNAPVQPISPIAPAPAPSVPKMAAPEAVKPAQPEPVSPKVSQPAAASDEFIIPLADLAPHWAASGQHDLAALQAHSLAMPLEQLMAGLKRGRLVFPWSQLRAWLCQAADTTLPELDDALPVTLPLAVVAPLYLARNPGTFAPKKAALVSDIPDIFDAKPKPALPAPEPAAPVADGAPVASKPLLEYGEIFGQPDKTTWSLREVAERCATLRGVAGMIVANHEGLLVAGAWPTAGQSDAVAAFIPRMHQRMVEFSRELTLGDSDRMTLTVENLPLEITRTGEFYMAVLGRAKENLPRVQLGAIAARLALHHQA